MNKAVENAITHMWEKYTEPLTLAEIADSALLSRYHFSRVFRDATGVSPGRFLYALRIYQAKRLLVSTSLSVTEISFTIGYNSLGSFTNRFTESVGSSPTRFRRMWSDGTSEAAAPAPRSSSSSHGTVTGRIQISSDYASARVYVGVFETPIIQRRPPSWTIVDAEPWHLAAYRLANVPAGDWFIRAVAVADTSDPEPWTRRSLLVGGLGPLTVTPGGVTSSDITLRVRQPTDLPILYAVPDLERHDAGPACAARLGANSRRSAAFATSGGRDAA
jgi:AraC family transcriptional regulator